MSNDFITLFEDLTISEVWYGISAPILTTRPTSSQQNIDTELQTLADKAGVFSFAQIAALPFMQDAENKNFSKSSVQNGVLVGYHLEAATQTRTKIFPRIFQKTVDFFSLKFRISERTF